jgi:hypothetical protein
MLIKDPNHLPPKSALIKTNQKPEVLRKLLESKITEQPSVVVFLMIITKQRYRRKCWVAIVKTILPENHNTGH